MSQITYSSKELADAVQGPKQVLWVGGDQWLVKTGADMDILRIPEVLSSRQFWLAVDDAGLTEAINTIVAASPVRVQIEATQATEFKRDYPMLEAMAAAIGKTSADIDAIFVCGDKL